MRLARLAPLALAVLPAAAASQVSEDPAVVALQGTGELRAGQYRTVLDLIEFEAPAAPAAVLPRMRDVLVMELAQGDNFCLEPETADDGMRRRLLEHLAAGECTFGSFDRTGAAVAAAMSCTGAPFDSQITMDGRIWSENADLDMTLQQDIDGLGATRMRVRAQSARIGDC